MGTKGRPRFIVDLYSRLEAASVPEVLAIEVLLGLWLPNESVHEVCIDGANDPPEPIIRWASEYRWQVEELPGPARVWLPQDVAARRKKTAPPPGDPGP